MMRFALLESGSKGNSFLLQDENTSILIDCGGTKAWLFQALNSTGMVIEDLDALLITHDHSDHISQIKHFRNVPVYSPVPIAGTEAVILQPDQAFQIEHLTITPIALSHDTERTVGYVITSWQEKLVYISSEGNYSNVVTVDNRKRLVTYQLGQIEDMVGDQLGDTGSNFLRLGRSLIINTDYIYVIDITKQHLILSDCCGCYHELSASREVLIKLKAYIESLRNYYNEQK